ncbi:hypothetical protein TNCV_4498381 [Trichonephila clavipes]|nr:hypothetical protein TNCV_4498381 [Trichonephila clavipes]
MVISYVDPGQSRRVGRPCWGCTTEPRTHGVRRGNEKKLVASTESRLGSPSPTRTVDAVFRMSPVDQKSSASEELFYPLSSELMHRENFL